MSKQFFCPGGCASAWRRAHRVGHGILLDRLTLWSDDLAYFLGLMITDGNVRANGQVGFVSLDRSSVVFVRDFITPSAPIREELTRQGTPAYRWTVWSKDLVTVLSTYGILPRKSLTVPFPVIPDEWFWSFLRGVVDGDGHIDQARRITISTGSHLFAEGLQAQLARLGFRCSIYQNQRSLTVTLGIPTSRAVAPLLYPSGAFCLERKRLRLMPRNPDV
jgi:hypothetical protein